jgi:hypothetical protein
MPRVILLVANAKRPRVAVKQRLRARDVIWHVQLDLDDAKALVDAPRELALRNLPDGRRRVL